MSRILVFFFFSLFLFPNLYSSLIDLEIKISDNLSGFPLNNLDSGDSFGVSLVNLGDLNNDGVTDLAVGAFNDENIDNAEGALYILFLNSNGTVNDYTKISDNLSGFSLNNLDSGDSFGVSLSNLGDLNNDGVTDLAVGAINDENNNLSEGAVYILFLNSSGSVKNHTKISDGLNGFFPNNLGDFDNFGRSLSTLGDLNNDGVTDLAVGAINDENGNNGEGAVYILFLNSSGSVKNHTKISDGLNGFYPNNLNESDFFGTSLSTLGDLNNDGIIDLAVGAAQDENIDSAEGAVYILFLNTNGSVKNHTKISDGLSGFSSNNLDSGDNFGSSLSTLGDLNNDGVTDLAVGAINDENIDSAEGAVYILFLNTNGSVKNHTKISDNLSGFSSNNLDSGDNFGISLSNLGDFNDDGIIDLVVGAFVDENIDNAEGAFYILFLNNTYFPPLINTVSSFYMNGILAQLFIILSMLLFFQRRV